MSGPETSNGGPAELALLAFRHFDAGDAATAQDLCRQILGQQPDQPNAHHLLGLIAHQKGDAEAALSSLGKALAAKPDYLEALFDRGNLLRDMGRLEDAAESFEQALVLRADVAEIHINLGIVKEALGDLDAAAGCYRQAAAIRPEMIEGHFNLGNVLKEQGALADAARCYERTLEINPNLVEALSNLGNVLQGQGKLPDAIARYREALALNPNLFEVHSNLALTLNMTGARAEALRHFEIGFRIKRGPDAERVWPNSFRATMKAKMIHDIEQLEHLAGAGIEPERHGELADAYRRVLDDIDWPADDDAEVILSDDHLARLGNTYNRPLYLAEVPEINGGALSDDLDVSKITADYYDHEFGLTHFDGLLRPEALESLRRFMMESTIWFDCKHQGGYLGAMLNEGLACPLLLQIADDLRLRFPDIFKDHRLKQLWAYKYDSRLTGIKTHADFAAVNVNFWITPDDANLNPASGGLVVHDVEAPLDWDFKSYNADEALIHGYIEKHGKISSVVPHRQNRIVLFNSDLFHATDEIDFKPGYENRRINVTMLFGDREA